MFIVYLSLMQKGRVTQLQYTIKCNSPDVFSFPINTSYLPPPEKERKVLNSSGKEKQNKTEV